MCSLIIGGEWIGRRGLYRANISKTEYFDSLDRMVIPKKRSFIILSYDLSAHTTERQIKRTAYPTIICCQIEDIYKIEPVREHFRIYYKGSSISDSDYMQKVQCIREHISQGTIYQANLTNRFDFDLEGNPESLACAFFQRQAVPYAFCYREEGFFILSGSMELFLSRKNGHLKSKPIKGTAREQGELEQSIKDQAENLMITDMMRNDLGKIAIVGSVKTTELFKVTPYSTLYQMHSTVEAVTGSNIIHILSNTFPPASVTGAPKIKAVEIIDSLEPHPRGYYCGSAGLLEPNGDFTLSVLIRTAYGKGSSFSYYAGCGIVWDSSPEMELQEMYLKVNAFHRMI